MKIFETMFGVKYPFDKLDLSIFPGLGNLSEYKSTPGLCFFHSRYSDWGNIHYNRVLVRRITLHIAKIFLSAVVSGEWWTDKIILDSFAKVATDQAMRQLGEQDSYFEWAGETMDLENASYHVDWVTSYFRSRFDGQGKGIAELHNPLSEGFKWNFNLVDSSFNTAIQYFEFFPEGFFSDFIKVFFQHYSWKSMSFLNLMEFLNKYLQDTNVKLDDGLEPAKLMKDILFRHYYTIVLVDQVFDKLEFSQINPSYEGQYIPLKFNIAFFNKENECCNI
jgi:hypothetical protein